MIFCEETKKGAILDPGCFCCTGIFKYKKIMRYIVQNNIDLKYIINTHTHFDHIGGNRYFKKVSTAEILNYKNGLRENDIIEIGNINLRVIETPGHSSDGICLHTENSLFTGDTLFVGDSGATISKDSNRQDLGKSLRKLINLFPPETIVWPGHNFGKSKISTIRNEQLYNINSDEYNLKSAVFNH